VLEHEQHVLELLLTRSTQTNEVGRCAVLLPFLAQLPGPLALMEVGASAGLCLLPDRYAYHYDDATLVGDPASPVRLACRTRGRVPIPDALPGVVWRRGIDIDPIDVRDHEATRWLECCIWPDQLERLARLRAAIETARHDPPTLVQGDLVELVVDVAATAPPEATLVIFDSAMLTYLPPERRRAFMALVRERPWIWISNEGQGVAESLQVTTSLLEPNCFVVGVGSSEVRAFAHPHGRWIEWD
jgi:hypothetical protein